MTRLATMLLGSLLLGCGTGLIQISPTATSASNTYLNNTPSLAADLDLTTSWNAGDYAPQ